MSDEKIPLRQGADITESTFVPTHLEGSDELPFTEDSGKLAERRRQAVQEHVPLWLFERVYDAPDEESEPVELRCPKKHRIGTARLIAHWIYNRVEAVDEPMVLVEIRSKATVDSAVPKPLELAPTYEDRLTIRCPWSGRIPCGYSAPWTQEKLIALVADALKAGRPSVRLPS